MQEFCFPMGKDFGQQFVDARNERGISIAEAAETTKIRVEYLTCIENGDYDFGLPDVYVRGFVKVYAKYLRLDVNEVMESCPVRDFDAQNRRGRKISYNAMIANENEQSENFVGEVDDTIPFSVKFREFCDLIGRFFSNKRRIVVSVSSATAIILVLVMLVAGVKRRGSNHEKLPASQVSKVLNEQPPPEISLESTGNVKVIVREKGSGEKIFSGTLESGAAKKISYSKPIQIFYDGGEFLLIKQGNGEKLYPQPGRGGIEIK
jgi:hypothetical protein